MSAPQPGQKDKREGLYPAHWKPKTPAHLRTPVKKYNSTSSLYINSTISKPNNAELIHCMAEFMATQIEPDETLCSAADRKSFEIFDECVHPLITHNVDTKLPAPDKIEKFIKGLFKEGQLAPESLVMAVAYVNRIRGISNEEAVAMSSPSSSPTLSSVMPDSNNNSNLANHVLPQINQGKPTLRLYTFNWKRVFLSSIILASKVWEDQAVWNVDFMALFPLASANDLGQLEKKLLGMLGFDVSLKASEYTKIYFSMRSMHHDHNHGEFVDLKPLDKEAERKLELKSQSFKFKPDVDLDMRNLHRSSGSVDDFHNLKSPRVILS